MKNIFVAFMYKNSNGNWQYANIIVLSEEIVDKNTFDILCNTIKLKHYLEKYQDVFVQNFQYLN